MSLPPLPRTQQPGDVVHAAPATGRRQGGRTLRGVGIIGGLEPVEHRALQVLQIVNVHPPHRTARQNALVGLTNDELIRRYNANESLASLAQAAGMTRSGLYERLRRLGLPPRLRPGSASVTDAQIRKALDRHGSVNAAAKALGVTREALTADAQRLGLLAPPPDRPDDLAERYSQLGSLGATAQHYNTSVTTVRRWLRSLGIDRKPAGRQARDG